MADLFQSFTEWYAHYGLAALFFGVLLENAGIPLPGETAVLVAAFLASPAGGERFGSFGIVWVILVTFAAAVLGDNVGYWLGRRLARPRLAAGRRFLFLTPARFQRVERYFERYGMWTVFFARFVSILRVVGALAAGTAGMHWPRFFLANAAGAAVWAVTISLLGYFFGRSWEPIHAWLGWGSWVVLGAIVLGVVVLYVWGYWREKSA